MLEKSFLRELIKKIKIIKWKEVFPFLYLTSANVFLGFWVMFLVGIVLALLVNFSDNLILIIWLGMLGVLIILYFWYINKKALLLFFLSVGLALGILRANQVINYSQGWVAGNFQGKGRLVRFPEIKNNYQRLYFEIDRLKMDKINNDLTSNKTVFKQKKKEIVVAYAPLGIKYDYGKTYFLRCLLKNPENKYLKFNYRKFLASKKVYQICYKAKISSGYDEKHKLNGRENFILGVINNLEFCFRDWKNKTFRNIYKVSLIIEERIDQLFSMPESAYLSGLLLGGDNRLPESLAESFRVAGTTHTVAVSGSNITILANVLILALVVIGFWRKQAFWIVLIGITVFIIMIGAPSSAVRAGIMSVILLYALQEGRLSDSWRILIFVAGIMVAISPFIILYDVGFQLSFLATLGIILIYEPLAENFDVHNDFLGLKSIILVTLSAQLGVLGILIYVFQGISLVSLLANILILPAIPMIMFGGVLSILVMAAVGSWGYIFAWPTEILLKVELTVIQWLAMIPGAMIKFDNISVWWAIGYYVLLVVVLIVWKIERFLRMKENL